MENLSREELNLEKAALQWARRKGIPIVKAAWSVALLTGKPDGAILKRMDDYIKEGTLLDALEEMPDELGSQQRYDDSQRYEDLVTLESRVGEIARARVLSLKSFGAVCSVLGTTKTLLLHISEVTDAFVSDIADYVFKDMEFDAMIIVNSKNELGLSTRRLKSLEPLEPRMEETYEQG